MMAQMRPDVIEMRCESNIPTNIASP